MNFTSCFRLNEPNPNPAPSIIVEEADSGLFEGGLDAHQGRDTAHDQAATHDDSLAPKNST